MKMQKFQFDQETFEKINAHAEKEYPKECCGWVIQNSDGSLEYTASVNLQDRYHKLDPEAYPRTSKDAFLMDVLNLNRSIDEARANSGKLYSIVHSHIDVGAYFSAEDKKQMSDPFTKDEIYPSACYLVVSVIEGKTDSHAVFEFDNESKDFIEAGVINKP